MLLAALRGARKPEWLRVRRLFLGRILSSGHLAILAGALAATIAAQRLVVAASAHIPWRVGMDAVLYLLCSLDFFTMALALVTADFVGKGRRSRLFEDLHLAGMNWRQVLSPLYDIILTVCIAGALLQATADAVFSREPLAARCMTFAVVAGCALLASLFVASLLLLMNCARIGMWGQVVAVLAVAFVAQAAVSGLGDLVGAWIRMRVATDGIPWPLGLISAGTPPGMGGVIATVWAGYFVAAIGISALLAMLSLPVNRAALAFAARLVDG
jgi:hypothetical protein